MCAHMVATGRTFAEDRGCGVGVLAACVWSLWQPEELLRACGHDAAQGGMAGEWGHAQCGARWGSVCCACIQVLPSPSHTPAPHLSRAVLLVAALQLAFQPTSCRAVLLVVLPM